ncbi:expressed unknown protein [Seminavis robusta]|uniref:Uncharacterized protein n=1 Tax=Seminavis robusta TaxID=568900 RepID=A0A9N8H452_9STRA|nr:expressed unknown protein [Seminavis robusta]|eukprot:Sro76_g041780.1 n/a (535) ;mRNA; f:113186-114790
MPRPRSGRRLLHRPTGRSSRESTRLLSSRHLLLLLFVGCCVVILYQSLSLSGKLSTESYSSSLMTIPEQTDPSRSLATFTQSTESDPEMQAAALEVKTKQLAIDQMEKQLAAMKQELLEAQQKVQEKKGKSAVAVAAVPQAPAYDYDYGGFPQFPTSFQDYVSMDPQWENLWDSSTMIPDWLKQYFHWHKQQRARLTPDNFAEQRYLVMTCLKKEKCGGLTDRLRPVVATLQVAHLTQRLFFIYWERPFHFEEFLLPPQGGVDWRMPRVLRTELYKTQRTGSLDLKFYQKPEPIIMSTMFQSWHYGENSYNERKQPDEPEAIQVFRDVWNVMFTPSPPVAQMIADSFDQLGIIPGQYSTAHIRALYGIEARGDREIKQLVTNALNCLSHLQSGGPYLVAADTSAVIRLAKEYAAFRDVTVVFPPHEEHPLHLGLHNESDTSIRPNNFYSIFNDMYLIAETRCTVVGRGGFGRWGILLGHEPTCQKFSSGFKAQVCDWRDPAPKMPEELEAQEQQQQQHHRVHAKMPFRKPIIES